MWVDPHSVGCSQRSTSVLDVGADVLRISRLLRRSVGQRIEPRQSLDSASTLARLDCSCPAEVELLGGAGHGDVDPSDPRCRAVNTRQIEALARWKPLIKDES